MNDVYLLVGELFLADEALDKIRAEAGTDPLSEVILEPTATSSEVLEALGTPTLLGGKRLVIVNDAHELKKDARTEFESYIEDPSPSAVLVLIASGRTPLDQSGREERRRRLARAPQGKEVGRHGCAREHACEKTEARRARRVGAHRHGRV